MITVEVVCALPERQTLVPLEVEEGTTVAQILSRPQVTALCPEFDLSAVAVGVFGQVVERERIVEDGDRIEIYRPLTADPKASRQARVARRRAERGDERKMRA